MRLFNIIWVPSGHSIGFAVERELENEQNRYKIVYVDDVLVQTILGGATYGIDHDVFNLLNRALYESEYHSLTFLQHLEQLFPIRLEEYVIKDTIFDDIGKHIRDFKVGDDSKYWEYPPNAAPYVMRPTTFTTFVPVDVPRCSPITIKTSS